MREILLVSSGWVHPPYLGRVWLERTLALGDGYSFTQASSLEDAPARELGRYAAVVLYFHYPAAALPEPVVRGFQEYVAAGGGVLAIHSATASYKATPAYTAILGGAFAGHGPVEPMRIRPLREADPIFGQIEPFDLTDEIYLHRLEPDLNVHFVVKHRGEDVPVVWTRQHGRGRVCYACPGHRAATMRHLALQEILRRGLDWVASA